MHACVRACVRSPVEALPDDEVMESGWEELGISDERAAEIATAMVEDDAPSGGMDFYKVGGGEGTERAAHPPRGRKGARHAHAMLCRGACVVCIERGRGVWLRLVCVLCGHCTASAVAYVAPGRA